MDGWMDKMNERNKQTRSFDDVVEEKPGSGSRSVTGTTSQLIMVVFTFSPFFFLFLIAWDGWMDKVTFDKKTKKAL